MKTLAALCVVLPAAILGFGMEVTVVREDHSPLWQRIDLLEMTRGTDGHENRYAEINVSN